jgi:hypothetical protein
MRKSLMFFSAALAGSILLVACSGKGDKASTALDPYENKKQSLQEMEAESPLRFLKATGRDKKNLLRQTVVIGQISNSAKLVAYKDVELLLSFYSKTGVKLEEDHETVYEKIEPGSQQSFKTKYFTPKGTDSVSVEVIAAKVAE